MIQELIEAGKFFYDKGWVPATSGNFSVRPDAEELNKIHVTASGKNKGELSAQDFIELNLNDLAKHQIPLSIKSKPSAETLLHSTIYELYPEINCVLHMHSTNSIVTSKLHEKDEQVIIQNHELLKALSGVSTHQHTEIIPIFSNTQNIPELADQVKDYLQENPETHAFLIAGHGIYTWGKDVAETKRHIEAFEALFDAELKLRLLQKAGEYELA